jgi:hypothetical protein
MKPAIKKLFLLVLLALSAVVQAQTFKVLHTFTGSDGANS